MSRLFAYQDYKLGLPPKDNSNMTEDNVVTHSGVSGNSAVEYMIELCNAERRINTSNPQPRGRRLELVLRFRSRG